MKIVYKEDYSIYNENMFVKKFKKLKFLGGPLDGLECEYEEFLSNYVEYSSNYIIGPSKDGIYRECEYKENVTIRFYLGDKMSETHTAENCEAKVDLSEREVAAKNIRFLARSCLTSLGYLRLRFTVLSVTRPSAPLMKSVRLMTKLWMPLSLRKPMRP